MKANKSKNNDLELHPEEKWFWLPSGMQDRGIIFLDYLQRKKTVTGEYYGKLIQQVQDSQAKRPACLVGFSRTTLQCTIVELPLRRSTVLASNLWYVQLIAWIWLHQTIAFSTSWSTISAGIILKVQQLWTKRRWVAVLASCSRFFLDAIKALQVRWKVFEKLHVTM